MKNLIKPCPIYTNQTRIYLFLLWGEKNPKQKHIKTLNFNSKFPFVICADSGELTDPHRPLAGSFLYAEGKKVTRGRRSWCSKQTPSAPGVGQERKGSWVRGGGWNLRGQRGEWLELMLGNRETGSGADGAQHGCYWGGDRRKINVYTSQISSLLSGLNKSPFLSVLNNRCIERGN